MKSIKGLKVNFWAKCAFPLRLSLTVKGASINVSNVSDKSCTLLWYPKKKTYLHETSMLTFTKNIFSFLPNLSARIICVQNRYTTVQTDLKYPLQLSWIFTLNILFLMVYCTPPHQSWILNILSYHPPSTIHIPNHE